MQFLVWSRSATTVFDMKFLLLTAALALGVSGIGDDEWTRYKVSVTPQRMKEEHKKVYTTLEENIRRLSQYLKTKEMVEEHNRRYEKGETSYTMGINRFSDWFPEEIQQLMGLRLDGRKHAGQTFESVPGAKVPDSIDWVEKGAVTSVKDQAQCASSYAFSAVGALEGLMFRTNKTITDLSEQELVDCSDNEGCGGGIMCNSFDYVAKRGGIDSNESYPYEQVQKKCRAKEGTIVASCANYTVMMSEDRLKEAVGTVGPVSITFAVGSDFMSYKSGVYNGTCSIEINHAMLAVGYGTDESSQKDFWKLKNSWGTQWGEGGYARVVRNQNQCAIGDWGLYPIY